MKTNIRIGVLLLLCIIMSCTRRHIYNTYFGTIDIDTARTGLQYLRKNAYLVHISVYDSIIIGNEKIYIQDTVKYYCDFMNRKQSYFKEYRDSLGNLHVVKFNPEKNYYDTPLKYN